MVLLDRFLDPPLGWFLTFGWQKVFIILGVYSTLASKMLGFFYGLKNVFQKYGMGPVSGFLWIMTFECKKMRSRLGHVTTLVPQMLFFKATKCWICSEFWVSEASQNGCRNRSKILNHRTQKYFFGGFVSKFLRGLSFFSEICQHGTQEASRQEGRP